MTSSRASNQEKRREKLQIKCHTSYENVPARAARHQYGGLPHLLSYKPRHVLNMNLQFSNTFFSKCSQVVCPVFFLNHHFVSPLQIIATAVFSPLVLFAQRCTVPDYAAVVCVRSRMLTCEVLHCNERGRMVLIASNGARIHPLPLDTVAFSFPH